MNYNCCHKFKLRCHSSFLVDLNEYADDFPEAKSSDKIGETELKKIPYNSMPNWWSKQPYVQGFYFETIT